MTTSTPRKTAAKPKSRRKPQPRGLSREQAHDLMARLAQDRPAPRTELDYTNPYTLLVAVGANPVAWLIPCHRVIAADGQLTGYHWGVERKRAMLAYEAVAR
jgi:hypothetical protein